MHPPKAGKLDTTMAARPYNSASFYEKVSTEPIFSSTEGELLGYAQRKKVVAFV